MLARTKGPVRIPGRYCRLLKPICIGYEQKRLSANSACHRDRFEGSDPGESSPSNGVVGPIRFGCPFLLIGS